MKSNWKKILEMSLREWVYLTLFMAALMGLTFYTTVKASAADLSSHVGGDCCADLEERIAELEATAARKGNRKVTLRIYGQVSESLQYFSMPGFTHTQVQGNANRDQDTFVGFAGEAKINPNTTAGFVLEITAGDFVNGTALPLAGGNDTNGLATRQAYLYVKNVQIGGLGIGLQNDATYGVTDLTGQTQDDLASTTIARTKMSFRPLVGSGFASFVADPWDGVRNESIKYVSPEFYGLTFAASWGDAVNFNSCGGGGSATSCAQGNIWDVSLRYNKEIEQFRVQAAVGYRDGTAVQDLPMFGGLGGLAVQDVRVWSGSAAVMHIPTGVFLNASYGNLDLTSLLPGSGLNNISAWEVQGGVEEKWTSLGHTTLFGMYGQDHLTQIGAGTPVVYGLGVVQGIDAAAMSVFLNWQEWTQASALLGGNTSIVEGGAKVRF